MSIEAEVRVSVLCIQMMLSVDMNCTCIRTKYSSMNIFVHTDIGTFELLFAIVVDEQRKQKRKSSLRATTEFSSALEAKKSEKRKKKAQKIA